jgi:hypothetical protein
MRSKSNLIYPRSVFAIAATRLIAILGMVVCSMSLAQTPPKTDSTSIERGSEAEKSLKLKEPSFESREARLKAEPLNWNSTIGKPKPKPKAVSHAEQEALRKAKSETSEGGKPDPNAEREARRLHPSDWDNVK